MSDHALIHRFTQSGTSTWTPLPASPLLGPERKYISNHRASLPAQSKAQVELGSTLLLSPLSYIGDMGVIVFGVIVSTYARLAASR